MIKVVKSYTITYVYAGIEQKATFRADKDGNFLVKDFHPSYCKISDVPSLDNAKTIKEILEIIKRFSYNARAEITAINGIPKYFYYKTKIRKDIKKRAGLIDDFIGKQCTEIFTEHIEPILIKKKWFITRSHIGIPVLAYINKNNEWANIPECNDEKVIEYMCNSFLNKFGLGSDNRFYNFFNYLSQEELEKKGLYKEQ